MLGSKFLEQILSSFGLRVHRVFDLHPKRLSSAIKPTSMLRNDSLKIPLARQPEQSAAVRLDVVQVAQPV